MLLFHYCKPMSYGALKSCLKIKIKDALKMRVMSAKGANRLACGPRRSVDGEGERVN